MNKEYFISICIPSYNRPKELERLLNSVDSKLIDEVQLVICEDKAPKRLEVRTVVNSFKTKSNYSIKYIENAQNLGHGGNLRECIRQADGEFVMFMGDDDMFIPNAFDLFFVFLKKHRECGYILRSYRLQLPNGKFHYCKYYDSDQFFEPGIKAYTEFYNKSVSMSGFTIKKQYAQVYDIEFLDKTLLFQLYLLAEVCLHYPSAYCNTPCAQLVSDGISYFGNNEKEKDLYIPEVKVINNTNFIKGFFQITEYIDETHAIKSTEIIKKDLSKYSYHLIASSRKYGIKEFISHTRELRRLKLDGTLYFELYFIGLLIFGDKFCFGVIQIIKRIIGRRLNL